MQTFRTRLAVDVKSVITNDFLQEARNEAQAETATPFLKECQARFPDDDDQFMLMIVCNAMRSTIRQQVFEFMLRSGVGGSVSPVEILEREVHVPKIFSETPPEEPVEKELKPTTLQLGRDPGPPETVEQREAAVAQQGI